MNELAKAVQEMEKAIYCLSAQVPEEVYSDILSKWNSFKMKINTGGKQGDMGDGVGKIPKIKDRKHALKEILHIATDKRSHIFLPDAFDWLELKMKIVASFARKGLK